MLEKGKRRDAHSDIPPPGHYTATTTVRMPLEQVHLSVADETRLILALTYMRVSFSSVLLTLRDNPSLEGAKTGLRPGHT